MVVLATAKGSDLDDAWAQSVIAARGPGGPRFDAFSLGPNTDPAPALKAVADRAGGTYAAVTNAQLDAAAQ